MLPRMSMRAALEAHERFPAGRRYGDWDVADEPASGPLTAEERRLRNLAAAHVWRARQMDEARKRGMTFEQWRAVARGAAK